MSDSTVPFYVRVQFYVFPVVEAFFGARTPAGDVIENAMQLVVQPSVLHLIYSHLIITRRVIIRLPQVTQACFCMRFTLTIWYRMK